MPVSTTWVFAEATEGKVASITQELLTKARALGGTVEAFYAGAYADAIAGELGKFGATKVYAADPGQDTISKLVVNWGDGRSTTLVASEPSASSRLSSAATDSRSFDRSAENDLEATSRSLTYPSIRSSGRPVGSTEPKSARNGG